MKKITITLFLIIFTLFCKAQSDILTFNATQATGGVIKACTGIVLKPGFRFTSSSGKTLTLRTDNSACSPGSEKLNISTNENYILTITPTSPISSIEYNKAQNQLKIDRKQAIDADVLVSVQYYDGLGRPTEKVQKGMTPDKTGDWLSLQTYDSFGREDQTWLPAIVKSNNGQYLGLATLQAQSRTSNQGDPSPYSKIIYESSPLNRVQEQYGPGYDWHKNKKSIKIGYLTNKAKSGTALTVADSLVCAQINVSGYFVFSYTKTYSQGELYVTRLIDEDGNKGYEFKDKLGQVILTRQISENLLHDTYYIYDDYGRLSAVFPPEASQLIYNSTGQLNNGSYARQKLAYLYQYNDRNLCISKKLPGADWIYYIYDKANNLIFSQDGEQRKRNNEWTFSIPDVFGRPAMTGIIQGNGNLKPDLWKDYNITPKVTAQKANTALGYTISSGNFNIVPTQIFTVNYYDTYDFITHNSLTNTHKYTAQTGYGIQYGNAKGLLTGSRIAILNQDEINTNTFTVVYYDNRGQVIQSHSSSYVGGKDSEYFALNHMGQPLKSMQTHTNPKAGVTITEIYTYKYDHAGRLLDTFLQLNGGNNQLIASNTYDDLGRLKTNKKGNNVNLNTNYTYDVRSRTKSMNSYHLAFWLDYTYGGNISKQTWRQSSVDRSYTFTYDGLSRLKAAVFSGGKPGEKYSTAYTYDRNGNIKTLRREGKKNTIYDLVDNLTYTYNGNQLTKIVDAVYEAAKTEGETDFYSQNGTNGEITYDANGAMASDTHKGIGKMTYNAIGLPASIIVNSHKLVGGHVRYLYSATGTKIRAVHTEHTYLRSIALMGTTTYAVANTSITPTDYIGNKVYERDKLKRILIPGGYIENNQYYYYLTDHLGNNRAVATAAGAIVQQTQYYPFGLTFADATNSSLQPYKYNGKEQDSRLQLNLTDYLARQNNTQYGRFTSVDPLAEKSRGYLLIFTVPIIR